MVFPCHSDTQRLVAYGAAPGTNASPSRRPGGLREIEQVTKIEVTHVIQGRGASAKERFHLSVTKLRAEIGRGRPSIIEQAHTRQSGPRVAGKRE